MARGRRSVLHVALSLQHAEPLQLWHKRQIRRARLDAGCGQQRVHLSAMMGLVIEHVRDRNAHRRDQVPASSNRKPLEIAFKDCRGNGLRPTLDGAITYVTRRNQLIPSWIL